MDEQKLVGKDAQPNPTAVPIGERPMAVYYLLSSPKEISKLFLKDFIFLLSSIGQSFAA